MVSQDGRGRHGTDRPIETGFDGLRLAGSGNHGENFLGLENLLHRHRDGALRNSVEILEPTFSDLLQPASLVQCHGDVRLFCIEIGGRIVERDMSIFADTQKRDIDRRSGDGIADAADYFGGLLTPIEQVIFADTCLRDQSILKKFAETRRVGHGETDIFVEVKELNSLPDDICCGGESFEKFELRRGAGADDTSATLLCDGTTDRGGCLGSRSFAQGNFVVKNSQKHCLISCAIKRRERLKILHENRDIIADARSCLASVNKELFGIEVLVGLTVRGNGNNRERANGKDSSIVQSHRPLAIVVHEDTKCMRAVSWPRALLANGEYRAD